MIPAGKSASLRKADFGAGPNGEGPPLLRQHRVEELLLLRTAEFILSNEGLEVKGEREKGKRFKVQG